MKICHVAINGIFLPPHEGGGVHEFAIAKNLSSLGNEVCMFIDRKDCSKRKREIMDGVEVRRLDIYRLKRRLFGSPKGGGSSDNENGTKYKAKRFGVKAIGVLLGLAAVPFIIGTARKCDVIYERSSSFGAGTFVSILLRKSLVVEVIDPQRSGLLLKFADGIVTHYDSLIPKHISRKNMLVMENAADTDKFSPKVNGKDVKKRYGLEGKKVITYIGGFHTWHALDKIVMAAKDIVKEFPDTRFMMVGGGPEREHIIGMVRDNDLDKNFVFTGKAPHDKIPEFLAASDVLVVLYTDPIYPNVEVTTKLCEYMAMRKSVVVYGVREGVLKHRKNGMLIKLNESINKKLEEYCKELLKNKTKRDSMGKGARKAISRFSWKDKAKDINDLFVKVSK